MAQTVIALITKEMSSEPVRVWEDDGSWRMPTAECSYVLRPSDRCSRLEPHRRCSALLDDIVEEVVAIEPRQYIMAKEAAYIGDQSVHFDQQRVRPSNPGGSPTHGKAAGGTVDGVGVHAAPAVGCAVRNRFATAKTVRGDTGWARFVFWECGGRRLVLEVNAVVESAQSDCIGATVPQEPGNGHDEVRQPWIILYGVSNECLYLPATSIAVPRSVRVPPSLPGGAICVTMETLNRGGWRGTLFYA